MPKALLFFIAFLLIAVACNKDKFQTKPSVKIKSINNEVVVPGGSLQFNLEFTDKQGDLGQGELLYVFTRQNIKPLGSSGVDREDTARIALPEFPNHRTGDITLTLNYEDLDEDPNESDSFLVKFAVADRGGNKSDTITSPLIIFKQ